ncbi:MAG: BON domain-containing protein [Candidatus Dormibacteraceae bacterium]
MSFEVEGTTVVLRGQLNTAADITRIEAAVLKIPGVGGVRNLLHITGTPAPNKAAALIASAEAEESTEPRPAGNS